MSGMKIRRGAKVRVKRRMRKDRVRKDEAR